jgi:hypothetical protein
MVPQAFICWETSAANQIGAKGLLRITVFLSRYDFKN